MDRFCNPSGLHHNERKDERTSRARVQALLQNSLAMAAFAADSRDRSELQAARRRGSNRQGVLCGFELSRSAKNDRTSWLSCSSIVFYSQYSKAFDQRALEQD